MPCTLALLRHCEAHLFSGLLPDQHHRRGVAHRRFSPSERMRLGWRVESRRLARHGCGGVELRPRVRQRRVGAKARCVRWQPVGENNEILHCCWPEGARLLFFGCGRLHDGCHTCHTCAHRVDARAYCTRIVLHAIHSHPRTILSTRRGVGAHGGGAHWAHWGRWTLQGFWTSCGSACGSAARS